MGNRFFAEWAEFNEAAEAFYGDVNAIDWARVMAAITALKACSSNYFGRLEVWMAQHAPEAQAFKAAYIAAQQQYPVLPRRLLFLGRRPKGDISPERMKAIRYRALGSQRDDSDPLFASADAAYKLRQRASAA